MKRILPVLLIQICLTTYGQVDIKELDRSLAKMNDSLYASKFEVSNKQYMDFISSLKKANLSDLLITAQIDSSKWMDKLSYYEPYVEYYHSHPAYKEYPVVNISHDAAILFCDWLTNEYNSNPDRKYKKVKIRLPNEQEWIMAAQSGDNSAIYPWQGKELKNKKGQYYCNFASYSTVGISENLNDVATITAPVKSYPPNKFGLYNMSGNVAEMLSDKRIIKGGSWSDKAEFTTISSKQNYDGKAKPTVGFRYFVEVIEK